MATRWQLSRPWRRLHVLRSEVNKRRRCHASSGGRSGGPPSSAARLASPSAPPTSEVLTLPCSAYDERAWIAMSRPGLKRYLMKKGVAQELVAAALASEAPTQRAAVVDFARAVDVGTAGMAHIAALGKALGLTDPWRNSREFMIKTKGPPKVAPGPAPQLPSAAKSRWVPPTYTIPVGSKTVEEGEKPTLFDFFESFEPGIA
mmetsp:Transcript_25737/g.83153  ORF Transcript_25737/g.83153 Transcript_25737/m.83153 type:complete len:203 (+) Transcript_25737:125-733(+)